MLHEMQGQANQSGAVAALELEVMDLLQKLDDASQRAARGEERLVAVEQELSDYKELNDLLEADNAKCATRIFHWHFKPHFFLQREWPCRPTHGSFAPFLKACANAP